MAVAECADIYVRRTTHPLLAAGLGAEDVGGRVADIRGKRLVRKAGFQLRVEDANDGAGGAGAAPLPDRRRHVTSWAGLRACVDIYGNYRGSGEGEERESHRRRPVREGTGPREAPQWESRGGRPLRNSSFVEFRLIST